MMLGILLIKPIKAEIDLFMRDASNSFTKSYYTIMFLLNHRIQLDVNRIQLYSFSNDYFQGICESWKEIGDSRAIYLVNEKERYEAP